MKRAGKREEDSSSRQEIRILEGRLTRLIEDLLHNQRRKKETECSDLDFDKRGKN